MKLIGETAPKKRGGGWAHRLLNPEEEAALPVSGGCNKNLPIHPTQLATLDIESQNWPPIGVPILSKTKDGRYKCAEP
jgi:hypothetical protein